MSRVEISVVIPCFNLGPYLDEAIDSCLGQSCQDFEILVVDDGSTEPSTRALLDGYKRPKTQLVRTPNRGLAAARNLGAAETSGEFLCFLDADDRLHPRFFAETLRRLKSVEAPAFASCWIEAFGDESWIYRPERCDLAAVLAECTVATPALVSRSAFEAVGGFDEGMPAMGNEDWDLWIHLLAESFQGAIVPEILFYYRRRRGSMVEECYYGYTYLILMDYLFRKYAALYRTHLSEVITDKDRELEELESNRARLHLHLEQALRPRLIGEGIDPQDRPRSSSHAISSLEPFDLVTLTSQAPYPRELMEREEKLLTLRRLTREMELERLWIEAELARRMRESQRPPGAGP